MKSIVSFIQESSTGEFKGKKGIFGKSKEYKKHLADHEQIEKYRKKAKELFDGLDRFKPGQVAEMWNYVCNGIGRDVRLGNIFGRPGKGSDAMTALNIPAHEAKWTYCMGWDSWCTVKDMDDIHTYTTGLGWQARSGNDRDLLEAGFDQVYSWLKTILYSIMDPKDGYQDFEDDTFFNCKNGEEIRRKYGWRV